MAIQPVTIEIADISSVGKSYFFTDVPSSIILPSKSVIDATLGNTIADINSSQQIEASLLAKDIIFIINGFLRFDQFPIPDQIFTDTETALNASNLSDFQEELKKGQVSVAVLPVATPPAATSVDAVVVVAMSASAIDFNTTGDNIVIVGRAGQTIKVYRMLTAQNLSSNLTVKDGAAINLTGIIPMRAYGSIVLDDSAVPWFTTSPGNDLIINQSGVAQVGGRIYYRQS